MKTKRGPQLRHPCSLLDDRDADHWDWMATLAFYAALHWLDASFADSGLHPNNHRQRNRAV